MENENENITKTTGHDAGFGKSPLTDAEISCGLADMRGDREARLLCEYWEVAKRINSLHNLIKAHQSPEKRARLGLSPKTLMIQQIKGMVKYANALRIRLDYEQGGDRDPVVVARVKHAFAAYRAGEAL